MEKIKSFVSWLGGVALLVLYFLLQRKTQQVNALENKIKTDSLTKDVAHATEKMETARSDYDRLRADYERTKHPGSDV